jgi:hypothetical protein
LLESAEQLAERGRDLYRIESKSAEGAIRDLLLSGDPWITMCAIAAAAEMNLKGLTDDIRKAGEGGGHEAVKVARAAAASLA